MRRSDEEETCGNAEVSGRKEEERGEVPEQSPPVSRGGMAGPPPAPVGVTEGTGICLGRTSGLCGKEKPPRL